MTKLCVDCKYFVPDEIDNNDSGCWALQNLNINRVTGERKERWSCSDCREHSIFWAFIFNTCGKSGRFFVEK